MNIIPTPPTRGFGLAFICAASFVVACSASSDPAPASRADLVASIAAACDTSAMCGGPQGDCDDQAELLDAATRESNGTEACDARLYAEYVDYNDCLAALSCAEFNTDTSCESMIDQAAIDAVCAP